MRTLISFCRWMGARARAAPVVLVAAAVLAGGCAAPEPSAVATPLAATPAATAAISLPPSTTTAGVSASPSATAAPVLRPLEVAPVTGGVGAPFTVTGEGFGPGQAVELAWGTVSGAYRTELNNNRVEFYERQFTPIRVALGQFNADAQGRIEARLTAPEDYGEVHDIFAAVEGADVARGGFRIIRQATMAPEQGPVGTTVTIRITGLGWKPFESTQALRYDNKYTGFVSATTTKGTAEVQIRAAGPVGRHVIEIAHASHAQPYLNWDQSPVKHIPTFRFDFTVTENPAAAPEASFEWPAADRVAPVTDATTRTTIVGLGKDSGVKGSLSLGAGPILSNTEVSASGLPPSASVRLIWMTVSGNDLFGWNLAEEPLAEASAGADGSLRTTIQIPESLGGWHAIRLAVGEKVVAELPFFVERSLVGVTPAQVKAGERFTVHLKGVGWTELDNGFAVTYDNAYLGYACGFATKGDVTINLTATGGPGVHLIDIYPMIYDGGHGKYPWQYQLPQLTALGDHPSLALGYRLPVVRLAIEIVQ